MISNHLSSPDITYSEILHTPDFTYIAFLTETWLSDKHFDEEVLPQDNTAFLINRKCETCGGVLIDTKKSSFTETKQVRYKTSSS